MTTSQFMAACQSYYGEPYQGLFRSLVSEYLDQFSDDLRSNLFQAVVRRVSRSYGKSPDIAAFESVIDESLESLSAERPPALPAISTPSDEELAETARLIEQSLETPIGRLLFGNTEIARKAAERKANA